MPGLAQGEKSHVDVIISWPKSMDYPLWRQFILDHQAFFNRIFIVFTETNQGTDYSEFVERELPGDRFTFLRPGPLEAGEDWRDQAVNMALDQSKSMWVWFTEQDLFVTDPSFWSRIALKMLSHDVIGYKEGNERMHPANMFVKREFINKTGRDFGIVPNKLDHFGRFFWQLRHTGANVAELSYDPTGQRGGFYHMNGLSHNLSLVQRGEPPVYKPAEFTDYLDMSLQIDPLDARYVQMAKTYLAEVKNESSD